VWRFTSLATHQSIEGDKICTTPSLSEECGCIHDRQSFCNHRGYELIYAHAICLGAAPSACNIPKIALFCKVLGGVFGLTGLPTKM